MDDNVHNIRKRQPSVAFIDEHGDEYTYVKVANLIKLYDRTAKNDDGSVCITPEFEQEFRKISGYNPSLARIVRFEEHYQSQ